MKISLRLVAEPDKPDPGERSETDHAGADKALPVVDDEKHRCEEHAGLPDHGEW